MKLPALASILYILCILFACQPAPEDNNPRKIEVLFLGHDSEHHNSYEFLPLLSGALSKAGINFTYAEDPEVLNEGNLQLFDALVLYANHDSITVSQEAALLNFVRSGKGFLPIHCASFCFRNSDEFVKLVGAQFQSHESGTFTATFTDTAGSVLSGMETFETWDETYVHHLHNPDRKVLMQRVDGEHIEPWTWTRTYGKGRVFYTAYGHDERTWSNPGFHELLRRGIIWAVGDRVSALHAQLALPTLSYTPKPNIPNYEKRDPAPLFQHPLDQAQSEMLIQVPPEFELSVFASEPDIINPIAMAWDERGRLWVVETVDYPNEVKSNQGDDRIKICEDTDGDGKADSFTIFAEGLNIPTGIVHARGGIIISMAPHFLFLKDTDGDDVADIQEPIITGWGTFDTHAGPSNLTYGFDNQIWGTVGYSGFEGTIAGKEQRFGQGFYRFSPDVSSFEYLTSTSNNTWGLGFSETFDVFGSTANNAHSWYMAIPNRYYEGIQGLDPRGSKKIAAYYAYHPVTPNFRQVDVFGGFTAAAGHKLYTARAFPPEYWNRIALVCEPTGHLLAKGMLIKQGAGFRTEDGWNLLASADEWVSPVHAEVGPDGAVWILDWYNFIIQHNPTPNPDRGGYQAENGLGNAHINPLRDRKHGRIYRIVYKDAPNYEPISLSKEDPDGLVDALGSKNLFWRLTAQRLLVERGKQDILPSLYKWIGRKKVDPIGINGAAIHALWTLHGLGALKGNNQEALSATIAALTHPSAGVRKAAVQVLPRNFETHQYIEQSAILHDPDPHTRLAAILTCAELPEQTSIGKELFEISKDPVVYEDEWLSQAVYIAAHHHANGYRDAIALAYPDSGGLAEQKEGWLQTNFDISEWKEMELPQRWEQAGEPGLDGRVRFRKEVFLDDRQAGRVGQLSLGPIDESDKTWINGVFIGGIENNANQNRSYPIPAGVLRGGLNIISVEVTDNAWGGGMHGEAPEMFLKAGRTKTPLHGVWRYSIAERFNFAENQSRFTSPEDLFRLFLSYDETQAISQQQPETLESETGSIRIEIKTLKNEMKFDRPEIEITAGASVELVFTNTDLLQHNLLIIKPGSLEKVGAAADVLATDPRGSEQAYVPEMDEVLHTTGLVDPNQSVSIRFIAPKKPGVYPFVCTFPGHWRMMNGVIRVMKKAI